MLSEKARTTPEWSFKSFQHRLLLLLAAQNYFTYVSDFPNPVFPQLSLLRFLMS